MMNIREYFKAQYTAAQTEEAWEEVLNMEYTVYEMEEEEFVAWAEANEVDLTATQMVLGSLTLVVQLWAWDFED